MRRQRDPSPVADELSPPPTPSCVEDRKYVNGKGRCEKRRYDMLPLRSLGERHAADETLIGTTTSYARVAANVRYILDVDRDTINGRLRARDVALIDVTTGVVHTWQVAIDRLLTNNMSVSDTRSAHYVFKYIHGIPMMADRSLRVYNEAEMRQELYEILVDDAWLMSDTRTAEHSMALNEGIIAYKGGDIECEWLGSISACRIDLGVLGCPKTDHVLEEARLTGQLIEPCDMCVKNRNTRRHRHYHSTVKRIMQ